MGGLVLNLSGWSTRLQTVRGDHEVAYVVAHVGRRTKVDECNFLSVLG